MEISSDNATMHAGGSINSHNGLHVQSTSVHHHVHNYQARSGIPMLARPHRRCPLPSPKFVGREEELRRLKKFFASSESDGKRFALIGMGGCGKSQIASEFTHSFILKENIYNPTMVFFIDGTSTTTLEESYASIAQSKGVGLTAQDALSWLSHTQEASFILIDNMDNAVLDLDAYMPRSLNAHILITTRLHDKGRHYASTSDAIIDLEALPTKDAEELLVKSAMLQPGEMKEVSMLVQELHCHALAIAQAGACIAFLHLAVSEYLERFRRSGTSLMDGKNDGVDSSALHGYSKVVRYTWELSYDQLPAPSKDVFNLCAFLHHTGITKAVFQQAAEAIKSYKPTVPFTPAQEAAFAVLTKALESCQGEEGSFDDFAFGRCIGPILSLSLMRCDPITRVYSIHPLVSDSLQRIVSNHLPTSLLLMLAISSDLNDTPFLYHLLPHVDSIQSCFTTGSSSVTHPDWCHPDIAAAFSSVHSESGRYKEAEKMQLDVLSQRRCLLGKDHQDTISAMHRLANSWSELGRHKEAEDMRLNVLFQRRRLLGEDHPDTVSAMHNLACSMSALGAYEKAEKMRVDVLSRRRRLLGEDHHDTLLAMHNLGCTMSELGRHEEAEEMRLDVLFRCRRLLGADHADTLSAMENLAFSWSNLGEHEKAEKMQRNVLSRRRRLLGEDHANTISAMDNVAEICSDLRRHEAAEKMRLDVLSRRRRLLGEDHTDTLLAMHNLGCTLSELGRLEEAEKMQREVLSRRRRHLGEDHRDTLSTMDKLAWSLFKLRRHEEAETIQQDVLSRYRRLLGDDHTHTRSAMHNLGCTMSELGRHREAEKMQRDLLTRRRHFLGENHCDTLSAVQNSGWTMSELGRLEEVEKIQQDVLSQRRRLLGEDHTHTLSAMHNLGCTLSELGRHEDAEKIQRDVLSRRRRLLGEYHASTVLAMHNLARTMSALGKHKEAGNMQRYVQARQGFLRRYVDHRFGFGYGVFTMEDRNLEST